MLFNNFIKTYKTELIKKKRSGIFTLSIILGILVPIVGTIARLTADNDFTKNTTPVNFYFYSLKSFIEPYAAFFFPLLIIITASKITQIDHKNKGWGLMETQPINKFSIYFSKYLLLTFSNFISILIFSASTIVFCWITTFIKTPEAHYELSIPFGLFLKISMRLLIASISLTAIQYVLSVLISGFIWPIIIGFFCLILPIPLKSVNIDLHWFPYQFTSKISQTPYGSDLNNLFTYSDYLSILIAFLFLFIGFNYYKFKTFLHAFWTQKSNLIITLGVLIFFSIGAFIIIQPKQLEKHNRTVLKGTVASDKTINSVYIHDIVVGDTIAIIPIKNNSFSTVITENIKADFYQISFDRYTRHYFFFGKNDSIQIDYKNYGDNTKATFKGTRLAEHQQGKKSFSVTSLDWHLKNNANLSDTDFYMNSIYKNWQKEVTQLSSARTVDNIIPKNDYLERTKKKIALKYISYWNSFKKKSDALFPGIKYTVSNGINDLMSSLNLNDDSLLSDDNYLQLISENLIKNDHRKINEDQKFLDAISKLENGLFKDRLLHRQLKKSIEESENISERDSVFNIYIKQISKPSYVALLEKNRTDLNRLSKSKTPPQIEAYNRNKEKQNFNDFKGNYVAIDVWASWCGPCKRETPYFEKAALALKDKPITFVSLSVDNSEADWLVDTKNKSDATIHLRVKSHKQFMTDYNINGIPRFILLNPEGLIEDMDFTRPSNKKFEEFLNNY